MENSQFKSRSVTLNTLREEQRALNMRLLLALRLRDSEVQRSLERELEEIAVQIEDLLSGRR
ncbi:MAG: hypothetical protein K2L38_04330 [Dysosmobacter sp.]|nr:hypothetical protein [Dysosmobacter sp.]